LKIESSIILPWFTQGPTQNLGPIGSAVLTFIGYKQTDRQMNHLLIFIYFFAHFQNFTKNF